MQDFAHSFIQGIRGHRPLILVLLYQQYGAVGPIFDRFSVTNIGAPHQYLIVITGALAPVIGPLRVDL